MMDKKEQVSEWYNNMDKNEQVLEWYNNFVDYVMEYNINMYNSACEYADEKEKE